MKIVSSKLVNNVSFHTLQETVALSSVFAFQRVATRLDVAENSFMGTLDSAVSLSVNFAHEPTKHLERKKKRARDSCEYDADLAVRRVERSGEDAKNVSASTFEAAKKVMTAVLRLKGASGESVIESWVVSIRKPGKYGNISTQADKPAIVIGFRLSAGVAIPLCNFCSALSLCRDGVLTTSSSKVDQEFNLPLTSQGNEAESMGLKSILVLATVPSLPDKPQ